MTTFSKFSMSLYLNFILLLLELQKVKKPTFDFALCIVQVYTSNNYYVNTYLDEHPNVFCTAPWHVLIEFNNRSPNNFITEIIESLILSHLTLFTVHIS